MQKLRIVLLAVWLTSVGGTLVYVLADEKKDFDVAEMKTQLNEMQCKRVETAQLCFDATQAAYGAETVTASQLITAMNNLVEAKLAVARSPLEEIAVLEEHVKHAQNVEKKIKVVYDVGSRRGEADTYTLAKFTRESAEISLLKARLKTKQ
jgi:hypothetical protein